jgi:hypothetical protein
MLSICGSLCHTGAEDNRKEIVVIGDVEKDRFNTLCLPRAPFLLTAIFAALLFVRPSD